MSVLSERREASSRDRQGESPAPGDRSPERKGDSQNRVDDTRNPRKGSGEVCAASLLVRNLSYRVTADDIRRMMTKYG